MKPRVRYLPIGSISSFEIRIPVLEVGGGQPVLSILCGMHGDENLGLLACHRFFAQLDEVTPIRGTIQAVPVANPVAQANGSRIGSDFLDLNRVGRGNRQGKLTERLGASLFDLFKKSTLVVDLHEFEMSTPLLAIYIEAKDKWVDGAILKGIATFAPRLVWRMDLATRLEVHYSGSLIAALIRSGIPCFAVEGSVLKYGKNIPAIANGLKRVAQSLGIIDGEPRIPRQAVAYRRHEVTVDSSGIWMPCVQLFEEVTASCTVGCLTSIEFQQDRLYTAMGDGIVIQLREHHLVHTGTTVCALGSLDPETTAALGDWSKTPVLSPLCGRARQNVGGGGSDIPRGG